MFHRSQILVDMIYQPLSRPNFLPPPGPGGKNHLVGNNEKTGPQIFLKLQHIAYHDVINTCARGFVD